MDALTYLPGFIAAYSILLIAASSPGPAVAMLLGISMQQGRGPALTASAGIACGSSVINLATLVGVGLLLSQLAWAMTLLRLIGAGYLLYLAWGAFRKAAQPPAVASVTPAIHGRASLFIAGLLMQITNPKAIVFWLAIASVGATEGGGAAVILAFVAGAWLISFACHGAWAVFLSARPIRAAYQRARRWIEGALGVFFTIAAYKLATSRT
jgi:threonine/homoserine/homoserine lactone efflux protein